MEKNILKFKYDKLEFEIDYPDELGVDNFDICEESAISDKTLVRIREVNQKNIFYNPYGDGMHIYDFDKEVEIKDYRRFNDGNCKPNTYFIIIRTDIEFDRLNRRMVRNAINQIILNRIINTMISHNINMVKEDLFLGL